MSTVVLVAGTGRSGTSLVAGILARLGVHMGDEFPKPWRFGYQRDFFGTYEEKSFFDFNRSVRPGTDVDGFLRDYVAKRGEDHEIWGVKDPVLSRTFPIVASYIEGDVKVIIARRNKVPTTSSFMLAYHVKAPQAERWYEQEMMYMQQSIDAYEGSILYVDYDDLLEHPVREVERIAEYVYGEEYIDIPGFVEKVAEHVDASRRRFDRDGKWLGTVSEPKRGWGNLAIGVRVAKYPEYHFFTSWTKMLTGGVRNGDTVLMPTGWMPAHWASNTLARDFLRTNQDSLFMVDDDMMFEQNDLETLRSNEANWDYDIVFGFCTHRNWPPRPVVMREKEFGGLPFDLYGRPYQYAYEDIRDNSIIEVDAVGLAFTLIKRRVLEAMTEEYGPMYTNYFHYGTGFESDDVPFAQKAKELGFRLGVDTSVKIGHVGQSVYGWNDYQQWMQEYKTPNVVEFNAQDLAPILKEALPHLEENRVAAENVLKWIVGDE